MNKLGQSASSKSTIQIKPSQKEIKEYQEAFSFFDADHDGLIETTEIGKVMRACGLYPCESEIEAFIRSLAKPKFDFNEFMKIVQKNLSDARINEEQIRDAFKIFDAYGNGLVNLNQMRVSLQNLGERLRDDELDELIREADIDIDGNVSYDELVKILLQN